eukprot:5372792-Pyramimonas_sp.AAC.1
MFILIITLRAGSVQGLYWRSTYGALTQHPRYRAFVYRTCCVCGESAGSDAALPAQHLHERCARAGPRA